MTKSSIKFSYNVQNGMWNIPKQKQSPNILANVRWAFGM